MTETNQAPELLAAAGALQVGARHVAEARADVTALSAELGAQITGMGVRWGGEGARAFHRVHDAWQEKNRRLVAVLDEFAASLQGTDRDNIATDQLRSEASARLLSRLG